LDALPQASIETLPYQTPASGGDESNEEEQP
jgi:hypothetical protein